MQMTRRTAKGTNPRMEGTEAWTLGVSGSAEQETSRAPIQGLEGADAVTQPFCRYPLL